MKNKRIIISAILIFIILSLLLSFVYADVWVNGYYRKDGTYVKGHWRSDPDGDPYNNWSFPGKMLIPILVKLHQGIQRHI